MSKTTQMHVGPHPANRATGGHDSSADHAGQDAPGNAPFGPQDLGHQFDPRDPAHHALWQHEVADDGMTALASRASKALNSGASAIGNEAAAMLGGLSLSGTHAHDWLPTDSKLGSGPSYAGRLTEKAIQRTRTRDR